MAVLLLTVFVDLVGFGMIFPILPFYAQAYDATPFQITLLIATYSALQIVSAPIWGRLSDRFGRKWILLTTLAGGSCTYLWFGLANNLSDLFLARGLSGAMAGNIAVAQAFAADVSSAADRAKVMGRIGAAFGLGFVVGPSLGGLLYEPDAGAAGFFLPCVAAAGLSGFAAILGAAILLEPAARQARRHPSGRWSTALVEAAQNGVPAIAGMTFVVTLSFTSMVSIFPIWCQAQLGWGPPEVGYAFAWIGLLVAGMQGLAIGPMIRRLGEPRVLLIGATCMSAGMLMAPFVTNFAMFAVDAFFMCAGTSFCHPTLTGLVSQRAGTDRQGTILGMVNAVGSTGRIASPPIAGIVFQQLGPNWPLVIAGVVLWPVIVAALCMALNDSRGRLREG